MARRQGAIARDPGSADHQSLKLDNPLVVQWEYASEERLAARNAAYRSLSRGRVAEDLVLDLVRELRPRRVLDVGAGMGELAEQVQQAGIAVCAIDLSPRMVELTKQRGVDAIVADVQQLPFEDGAFDAAVANWVLYHVPDLDRGVAEVARVLEPGGTLFAATVGEDNMVELWEHVGGSATRDLSFGPDNGLEVLRRHFAKVERHDVLGTAIFPDTESIKRFVAMTIQYAHLAENVPEIDAPFETRSAHTVFIARKAA